MLKYNLGSSEILLTLYFLCLYESELLPLILRFKFEIKVRGRVRFGSREN
jgi:hypothetical protein